MIMSAVSATLTEGTYTIVPLNWGLFVVSKLTVIASPASGAEIQRDVAASTPGIRCGMTNFR